MSFKISLPAKWVLTGEHSVLRGAQAVAIPHWDLSLKLEYLETAEPFRVDPPQAGEMITALSSMIASRGCSLPRIGILRIESGIPVGSGLGSSAAFCCALALWLLGRDTDRGQVMGFATALEDYFHGKSSGMDVATILAGEPVVFSMEGGPVGVGVTRLPCFKLHDTSIRSRTSECVAKVRAFQDEQAEFAKELDEKMARASQLAIQGLKAFDVSDGRQGLDDIALAMREAQDCFLAWGLVPIEVVSQMTRLYEQGALAVKMTGAGGGGYLVSLWDR